MKSLFNRGLMPPVYFWRDKIGHEIDALLEKADSLTPIEIKSGKTIGSDFFKGLQYWKRLSQSERQGYLVYGGSDSYHRKEANVFAWKDLASEHWL